MKGPAGSPGHVREAGPNAALSVYPLLLAVVFALGINWPFISIGLESIPPLWFTFFRFSGAAAIVATVNLIRGGLRRPPRRDWPVVVSVGVFRIGLLAALVFVALQFVPPGRSAVLVWTTSLWTVPLAAFFLGERLARRNWVGLVVGIAGIVVLVEPWVLDWSDTGVVVGIGLLLTAAIMNAAVSVQLRGHDWTSSPRSALPWQLTIAAAPLGVAALLIEGSPGVDWSWLLLLNVGYQAAFASGFALWAQQVLYQRLPATTTNLGLMAVPAVGLLASAVIVDEPLTTAAIIGLVAIVTGVVLNLLTPNVDHAP